MLSGVSSAQEQVLRELAPYELGEGWPNPEHPEEAEVCRSLTGLGLLSKRGRRYRLTERGRAHGLALLEREGE